MDEYTYYDFRQTGEEIQRILDKADTLTGNTDPVASTAGVIGQFYVNRTSGRAFVCTAYYPATSTCTWVLISGGTEMLEGAADPTTSTAGEFGQFYYNYTDNSLFVCTFIGDPVYRWTRVTAVEKPLITDQTNPTTSTVGKVGQFYHNNATRTIFMCVDIGGSSYDWLNISGGTYTSAVCETPANNPEKVAKTFREPMRNQYFPCIFKYSNTYAGALKLFVDLYNTTSTIRILRPLYINGSPSSATNYNVPYGSYIIYFDGTNYYLNTDGTIPNVPSQSDFDELEETVTAQSSQIEELQSDIDLGGTAIPFSVGGSGFINYASGGTATSSNYSHTNYVELPSADKKLLYKRTKSTSSSAMVGIAFYAEDKTFISGIRCALSQPNLGYEEELYAADIPQNAKYARFSTYTDTTTYGTFAVYKVSELVDKVRQLDNEKADADDVYTKTEVDDSQSAQNALITALQNENAQQADDIKFLKAVTEGKNWIAEVDSDEAYSKTIKSQVVEPYNKASIDSYGGKSRVANQIFTNFTDKSGSGLTWVCDTSDYSITVNGTATAAITQATTGKLIDNHVYYYQGCPAGGSDATYRMDAESGIPAKDYGEGAVFKHTSANNNIRCRIASGYTADNLVFKPRCADLTLWLGITETSQFTAEMKAEVKSYFDKNPAPTDGEIVSAEVQNVVSRGKNLLDPTLILDGTAWNNVEMSLKPNATYRASTNNENTALLLYMTHSGGSYGSTARVTSDHPVTITTNNDGIVKFQQRRASGTDSFANYEWQLEEGSTVTPYSPYRADTLPIPSAVKALEGYGWSAGSVYNEIDFVRKKFVKRVGSVDLGSLDWTYAQTSEQFRSTTPLLDAKLPPDQNANINAISAKYDCLSYASMVSGEHRLSIIFQTSSSAGRIWLKNSDFTDIASFKSAMNGVMLYYELAEPVEYDISSYLADIVDEKGNVKIEVESGGTVTYEQQEGGLELPIPNTISYLRKVVTT